MFRSSFDVVQAGTIKHCYHSERLSSVSYVKHIKHSRSRLSALRLK